MLGFCLVLAQVDLGHAITVSLSSYVNLPFLSGKHLKLSIILGSFCLSDLLLHGPLSLEWYR